MMDLTFAKGKIIQIDDAHLLWRNFKGREEEFNRKGDRNFNIVIETAEQYNALKEDVNDYGIPWNIAVKESADGSDPRMTMKVKVKFSDRGPNIYLIAGNSRTKLTEETVGILDDITIARVDLDIRPYDDTISGKPFRAAYLKNMEVIQDIDRFEARAQEDTDED